MPATIDRLIGVYDADGSIRGELAYVVGKALRRRSCALCDLTHGKVRRRPEFDDCVAALGVQFDLVHRDEQTATVRAAAGGRVPVVLGAVGDELVELLGGDELRACAGDPVRLVGALRDAAAARRLTLG